MSNNEENQEEKVEYINYYNYIINGRQVNIANDNATIIAETNSLETRIIEREENGTITDQVKANQGSFVKTTAYNDALEILRQNNFILLSGSSGIGKSETSIMLAAQFESEYETRTIDGVDSEGSNRIKDIIQLIKTNYTKKEIVIFDDFLGKTKLNEERSYLSAIEDLFKIIKDNHNKKIVLNSRSTIIESLRASNSSVADYLEYDITEIDLNKWDNNKDKCEIFAKYIIRHNMIEGFQIFLSDEKGLNSIIEHPNFTPLVIDRAINKCKRVKPNEYLQTILDLLNHPDFMWKKEIEALNSYSSDYLKILYSLSDIYISIETVNDCFLHYYKNKKVDYNEALPCTIERINALVKYDDKNRITFRHPSIIDTLLKYISEKDRNEIITGAKYIEQIERLDAKKEYLRMVMNSDEIFKLKVLPFTYINSSFQLPNSILIKYLEYVMEWNLDVDEELLNIILDKIFEHGRLVLLHSADLIINVLSLNYDFSPIFNNGNYMRELYSCANYENIWKLLDLTEKKMDGKVDYEQAKDYIKSEIVDKLADLASDKVNEYIESVFQEYTVEFFDDYDDESEESYDDIAEEIVNNILDDKDIVDITDQVREDTCNNNLINYDACLSAEYEINIDYDSFATIVQEYWENN